jgi:hypothetical protein
LADLEQDNRLADLSAYLDGELGAARAAEVERLLAESPDARQMLDELHEVRDRVRALPRARVPAQLNAALRQPVQARWLSPARPSFWSGRVLRVGVPLAAAAAAVLAVGLFLRHQTQPEVRTAAPRVAQRLSLKLPGAATVEPTAPLAAAPAEELAEQQPEADSERFTSLGCASGEAAVAPPVAEGPAVAVVIHARDEAEYARNAALLESWSRQAGRVEQVPGAALPAGQPGGEVRTAVVARAVEAAPGTAPRALAYAYQLALPELDARVAQLLEVNPPEQITVQTNFAAEDGTVADQLAPTAPPQGETPGAGLAQAAPLAGREEPGKEKAAPSGGEAPRAAGAAGRGGKGAVRRPVVGEQRDEVAKRERLHAQHMAVTAEPEVILIEQAPASQPSASQPGPTSRAAGLLAREGGRRGGVGGATTQASPPRVELRVELLPAAPTTAPASRPAREVGGGARD